ncbi:hypothetical protein [Tychonema bourrellyi]|uniref:hypothetical protein n=1 Tax=Tychonema bourrellyi TaxID=54313 RepID=UPI000BD15B50|nr:hypothetical protein [Tychonema bourrellyi]
MPVPQKINFLVEQAFCLFTKEGNRQDACSTKDKFSGGTGILPVHKRVEQASCLFTKDLLRMVQHLRFKQGRTRQCPWTTPK